jgi:ABC-type sulfate transport system permease subunit
MHAHIMNAHFMNDHIMHADAVFAMACQLVLNTEKIFRGLTIECHLLELVFLYKYIVAGLLLLLVHYRNANRQCCAKLFVTDSKRCL